MDNILCQCPITGLFHFYSVLEGEDFVIWDGCQCPITGLFHFYGEFCIWDSIYALCQCPITGLFHFYFLKKKEPIRTRSVSMPYNGPIPFLPQRAEKKYHALSEVSMPYNGPIPFLRSGLRSCINTGFPRPLLRVIHRIF